MSLSYDSLIFFITSSSALEHASMAPFTVMVRSGLYKVRSWSLDKGMGGGGGMKTTVSQYICVLWQHSKHNNIKNSWCAKWHFYEWTARTTSSIQEAQSAPDRLTVRLWSWSLCPARFSSSCVLPSQLIFLQSCCVQGSSVGSPQYWTKTKTTSN